MGLATSRIRCSRLHGPGVVLLGAAAHAVTMDSGQGFSAASEDCNVLCRVLDEVQVMPTLQCIPVCLCPSAQEGDQLTHNCVVLAVWLPAHCSCFEYEFI